MSGDRFVRTQAIQGAVRGHEIEVLSALGINPRGRGHITCPFPDHDDADPSWRWDERRARAHCTCANGHGLSIFDVLGRLEAIDFDAAKIRTAELIGRADLIEEKGRDGRTEDECREPARATRQQGRADAATRLPRPPAGHRVRSGADAEHAGCRLVGARLLGSAGRERRQAAPGCRAAMRGVRHHRAGRADACAPNLRPASRRGQGRPRRARPEEVGDAGQGHQRPRLRRGVGQRRAGAMATARRGHRDRRGDRVRLQGRARGRPGLCRGRHRRGWRRQFRALADNHEGHRLRRPRRSEAEVRARLQGRREGRPQVRRTIPRQARGGDRDRRAIRAARSTSSTCSCATAPGRSTTRSSRPRRRSK